METYLTAQNEWIILGLRKATVGLNSEALKGDIVYIELPETGRIVQKGEPCATVESIKAVAEVHAPVSGVISAVNELVLDSPDTVTQADTWLFTVDFDGDADTNEWTIKT